MDELRKRRVCYLFVFDGYADWEPSHVVSGLNTYSDFEIRTFSVDGQSIRSMGNLKIIPDQKLEEMVNTNFDLLILPGGKKWEEGGNMELKEFILARFEEGKTIAAICAATTFLATCGIFSNVKHTSNGLKYLKKQIPGYKDDNNYLQQPCVTDKNIITANGAAMIEFAYAIFEHFGIFKPEELEFWLALYKSGGMVQ
jgi:Putative intracellular protease/amidase